MFKLTNFKINYDGFNVINNVNGNFIVENEINIIFGQNGVGKTSLIEALNLVSDNYEGEITYLGHNYHELNKKQKLDLLNSEFAYIPQKFNLIDDLNVIENLELVANKKHEKNYYIDILEKLNIGSSFYSEKVKKLSLGMKQRVAIARALVNNPRVIFFDEPTASLDFKNIDNFISIIEELRSKGVTVVIITHDNIFFEKYKYIIEVENTKVIPTYIINNDNSEVEFIKQRKKNIKLINKSSRISKYLFFLLILISTLIASAVVIGEATVLYHELYRASPSTAPDDAIVLTYEPYSEEPGEPRYYTPKEVQAIENVDGVKAVYPYSDSTVDIIEYVEYQFQNTQVQYLTEMMLLPKHIFSEYNYLGLTLTAGDFPEDNSNEILISSHAADYLIYAFDVNTYEEIIGTEGIVVKDGDLSDTKVVISGIYTDEVLDMNEADDPVYFGYNSTLIAKYLDAESIKTDETKATSLSSTYDHLYIELDNGANKVEVENTILKQSNYLYAEKNYMHDNFALVGAIIVSLLIYSLALIIIFALIKLKNRQQNNILLSLGYKQSVINHNTIKQNNKAMLISLVIVAVLYGATSFYLGVVFMPILFITIIVIFITSLICNLITSIFIK